ncbi:MAG: hypothetical protein AAB611_00840, partial [Patescibacteria group bacterium]
MIGAPKGPEKKEKPKEAFESVAKGFKLVVEKIKKWWESGSKPEERDFTPVAEARDSVREELRDQNERDGKPGRPFVASRSAYGEAAGMIGNPEVSLSVGDPILLQGKDGAVVDRLVTAEDVEKQRLIDRNREYIGGKEINLSALGSEQAIRELEERKREISKMLVEHPDYKNADSDERTRMLMAFTDLDEASKKRFKRFSPDAIANTIAVETAVRNVPQDDRDLVSRKSEMTEVERSTLQERWTEEVIKEAVRNSQKPTEKQESALQQAMMAKFKEAVQEITLDEAKDRLKDSNQRMATLELLVKQDQQQNAEEALFAIAHGELKAMNQVLELLRRGKVNPNSILKRYGQLMLRGGIDIASAREARRDGFDRVSMKPADPALPPVEPPTDDVIVDPPPPPIGPRGPERVVTVQDLKNEFDRLRDVYIMDRRATRG